MCDVPLSGETFNKPEGREDVGRSKPWCLVAVDKARVAVLNWRQNRRIVGSATGGQGSNRAAAIGKEGEGSEKNNMVTAH
jgi:hypothetical protein